MKEIKRANRRAFVTGATGFVGYHLVKRLLREEWRVDALLREGSATKQIERLEGSLSLHEYDGTTESIIAIMRTASPEVVFHLASRVEIEHHSSDVENLLRSNVILGTQLLESMHQTDIPYFINTGSYWQHFDGDDYNPVNLYAATKQAFQDILRFYTETSSIRALTLKLFDVYGPNDPRNKLFHLLEDAYRQEKPLAMSPGKQCLDLVYVDDVVQAFCHAANLLRSCPADDLEESYAVTSMRHIELKEVVDMYQRVTGRTVKAIWGGRPYRNRQVMAPWKGKPLPGWKALVDLETGIQLMHSQSSFQDEVVDRVTHTGSNEGGKGNHNRVAS